MVEAGTWNERAQDEMLGEIKVRIWDWTQLRWVENKAGWTRVSTWKIESKNQVIIKITRSPNKWKKVLGIRKAATNDQGSWAIGTAQIESEMYWLVRKTIHYIEIKSCIFEIKDKKSWR